MIEQFVTLVIAVGLVVAGVLYFLGKSHKELQRARAEHPSSRQPPDAGRIGDQEASPSSSPADAGSPADTGSPADSSPPADTGSPDSEKESAPGGLSPKDPEALPSDTSLQHPTTLLQVFEEASCVAAGEAAPAADLAVVASSLEEALSRAGIPARPYRSGLLVSHGDQSAYLVLVRWDRHSKTPPPRTAERLLAEFETSGCDSMAIVTDAPHSFCRSDSPFEGLTPLVIPAEGIAVLLRGLERLGRS